MKIGRNDPCPCGSGRKYKQCCLTASAPSSATITWHRLRRLTDGLPADLLRFARNRMGDGVVDEAWHEFMRSEGGPFSTETAHLPVFMPWFFYDWTPDPANTPVGPDRIGVFPVGRAYLRARPRLDPLVRRYVEACCDAPFSFFDVVRCMPGTGFVLRDILSGVERDVTEKSASQSARVGDIVYAKVVTVDDVAVLDGCTPVLFPQLEKSSLLALRRRMGANRRAIDIATLRDYAMELRDLYLETSDRLLNPRPPMLRNTDGDPLEFHRVMYDIDSPSEVFRALRPLAAGLDDGDVLSDATYDAHGGLVSVDFPWLKTDTTKRPSSGNTVLGRLTIDGGRLVAEVNSQKRAQQFRAAVEELLADRVRYRSTVVEPIEGLVEETGRDLAGREDDVSAGPEAQAQVQEFLREHYRAWVSMSLPALGGKTPLQAMRTRDGREMVEALLLALERGAGQGAPGVDDTILGEVRAMLAAAVPGTSTARRR